MKAILLALTILFAASTSTFAQAKQATTAKHQKARVAKKYTCEMHPEVVKGKPGKCPRCGMKLMSVKSKKTMTKEKTDTKS